MKVYGGWSKDFLISKTVIWDSTFFSGRNLIKMATDPGNTKQLSYWLL